MAGEDQSGAMPTVEDIAQFVAEQTEGENGIQDTTDPVIDNDVPAVDEDVDQDTGEDIPGKLGEDPDLSDLDPAVRLAAEQRLRDWRADYTQKGQSIAEIRKMADEYAGGDIELMKRSLEFTHRLQTDPEFRAALYQELSGQQGTPTPQATPDNDNDYLDDDDIPSGVRTQMNSLEARLAQFEARDREMQEEARHNHLVAQAEADLDRQMDDIRKANPDIQDKHVEQIYAFGHSTGGDLYQAEQMWRDMRNDAQSELIANKQGIPNSISAGRPSSNASAPLEAPKTLEEASSAAAEFLREHMQG